MKKIPLLFFFVGLLFASCKDDENEIPSKPIFTYKGGLLADATDTWVIVRAYETGELLDAKEITSPEPVTFETNKDIPNNRLSVSRFMIVPYGQSKKISGQVYQVDVGAIWQPGAGSNLQHITPGPQTGTYAVKISDVPSVYSFGLSDRFGDRSIDIVQEGEVLEGDVSIIEDSNEHLISIGNGIGNPKYAFISNPLDGDAINLSYNDFEEFDHVLKVSFPKNSVSSAYVTGFDNAVTFPGGYVMYQNMGWGFWTDATEFNIGFLDRFPNYVVQMSINGDFDYFKRGPTPTSVEYIGSDKFTITDRSITGYAVTASQGYLHRTVMYDYSPPSSSQENYVGITYLDPTPNSRHNDPFTPELIQKFSIPMDKVLHWASYFCVKGTTYEQVMNEEFDGELSPANAETAYVIVR